VPFSGADFIDWQARSHAFAEMAAYTFANGFTRTANGGPEEVTGLRATGAFFSALGVRAQLGRVFSKGDDTAGQDHVVVLSSALWQRWFDGRSSAVGSTLDLQGTPYTVIGVLPEKFKFEEATNAELWVPLALEPGADRGNRWLRGIGRLAPGVTVSQAQAEMNFIAGQLQREYPHDDAEQGVLVQPFQAQVSGINEDTVLLFFGAVTAVLLIVCANVAGLQLARAAGRRKVFAMRTALGASRKRVIQELLIESFALAMAGGFLGVAIAYLLVPLLRAQQFVYLPRADAIAVDGRILLFAAVVSLATGVLFGLSPALELSRLDLGDELKTGSGDMGLTRRTLLRNWLIIGEIALSCVLLVSAGLLAQSLARALETHPGYRTHQLLTFWLTLPPERYQDSHSMIQVSRLILEKVAKLPGVRSTGLTTALPPSGWEDDGGFAVVKHPPKDMQHAPDTIVDAVSPGFFQAMGLPLLRGRLITEQDNRPDGPKVVVVSRTLANRYFAGENPIGQQMKFEEDDQKNAWTVVGVVGDTRFFGWDHDTGVFTYFPYAALGKRAHFAIAVEMRNDPASLTMSVKKAIWSVDKALPLLETATMEERMREAFAARRFDALLLAGFAGVALLLAAIGLFGLLSYVVAQKTREIGVRMAVGAEQRDVLMLVVRRALALAAVGVALGLPCGFATALLLRGFLYGTQPFDAVVFAAAPALLLLTAGVAALLPAWRASRVDPMSALRVG
jgi:putative ABC transport system permease protein